MLAGEKGIWGTLEPWLKRLLFRNKSTAPSQGSAVKGN
jgi:hypothetical protein